MPSDDPLRAGGTPTSGTAGAAVLDHVAVAVEEWSEAWPRYVVELGGEWASGGFNVGFGPAQLRYANGARIEILQPWEWEDNPFLRRFLDGNGPGPHHLTFKVPDLRAALDAARDSGFEPVGVDLADPSWMEAFLHPRQAMGIVVQMAQAEGAWTSPAPEGFPTARRRPTASLERATHVVDDMDAALGLFRDLLGGAVLGEGRAEDGSWRSVDLDWAAPLRVRLVAAPDGGHGGGVTRFLDGRPGRLHHLYLTVDDPGQVPGATLATGTIGVGPGPTWVVEAAANLGTRLVLQEPEGATPRD